MRKSALLLSMIGLCFSSVVFAQNPFSDVPAGHWAYDSISKLAASGVIEGYGNGMFGGDRLMTRYEMAQIVAKAMSKGANVDRLAAEFANELESLGVRVYHLEQKSDNVKITGEARFFGSSMKAKGSLEPFQHSPSGLRSRVWITGHVNDDWHYVGMLENMQDFTNHTGDEDTSFQRAYLEGKIGNLQIEGGRLHQTLADGNLYDLRMDGLRFLYGNALKFGGYYGKPSDSSAIANRYGYEKMWGVNASADVGKALNVSLGYDKFDKSQVFDDNSVFNVGVNAKVAKDVGLGAMYLKSNSDDFGKSNEGYVVKAQYGGAKYDKVGSFGIGARYYKQGLGTFMGYDSDPISIGNLFADQGFRGYGLTADYTVAKNMKLGVQYYDLKGKEDSRDKSKILWGDLTVRF